MKYVFKKGLTSHLFQHFLPEMLFVYVKAGLLAWLIFFRLPVSIAIRTVAKHKLKKDI